jgi:hypothetical protein
VTKLIQEEIINILHKITPICYYEKGSTDLCSIIVISEANNKTFFLVEIGLSHRYADHPRNEAIRPRRSKKDMTEVASGRL